MSTSTKRAAVWAFLAVTGTRIITLGSLSVLARLLAPREFGLLAFALVYITYAETIGDLGTATALIYWKDRREDAAQITFLINAAMGVSWCLLTLALAQPIASFFHNPDAAAIVRVLAFGFLIKFLGNTHDALAQKDMRFRARAIPEVGLAATKAGISIALALMGFGAWSLVWGHLAGMTAWTVASWLIVDWRPNFTFPRELVAPMLRYGRGIVAVNIIAAMVHHADLAIVGRMLGPIALGLYQIADKIPDATITIIIWVGSKVLFPAFARIQQGGELRRAYLKALTYVSIVTVPVAGVLAVAAGPIVAVFFGPKWRDAAPILQWLAIYAGVRSLGSHAGDILKATGRSGVLASFGVLKAAVMIPALMFGARYGTVGVAIALTSVTAFTSLINVVIIMKQLDFGFAALGRALRTSLLAGVALAIAALIVRALLIGYRPEFALAGMLFAGTTSYVAA
ncbi:MAG TPA: lipopolysaccharide biosynthesis protein, partial [Thermoanaerobaculia bacterium]